MNIKSKLSDRVTVTGSVLIEIRDAKTGRLKSSDLVKNMFVTLGKNSIASRLTGVTSNNQGTITYCALGTSVTAPALNDIKLDVEIARKAISVRLVSGKIATFQTFFNTSEANGTLREAGLFGDDASATADTGTLFARTDINRTKTTLDTLTLTWTITIS